MSPAERRARITEEIAERTGIDEAMIERLVRAFYAKVREDALLGPVFAARISDWEPHLRRMTAFWSSVALMSGRYHGRPMEKHLPLSVDHVHFARWLALFEATAHEVCPPAGAAHVIVRAHRIARSIEIAMEDARAADGPPRLCPAQTPCNRRSQIMNHLVEHPAAHEDTADLIAHILGRYHDTHRRELPALVALAEKVETVHGTDPNAPHGLAEALKAMVGELEVHMKKEELILFPAMSQGRGTMIAQPIAVMRHDHAEHEQALARIGAITHGFRLPKGACRSWTRLYAGVQKLVKDLDEHMRIENEVLFPRFEESPERSVDVIT